MKIILDTNIYFSAFVFDKDILKLLDLCYDKHAIYSSKVILKEIQDKLFGDKIKKIKPQYDFETANEFYMKIENETKIISPTQKISVCRDPKDNMFLEIATEIKADYIITGDKDLLVLKEFNRTKILKPSQFLALL